MHVAIPVDLMSTVQGLVRSTPVVLFGSGFACGYGLASMRQLGAHLSAKVEVRLKSNEARSAWLACVEAVKTDLEAGLNDIPSGAPGRDEVVAAVRAETAELIGRQTREVEARLIVAPQAHQAAPVRLLRRLYDGSPVNTDCIPVITTNYDTLIETFADLGNIPLDNGFHGFRRRQVRTAALFETRYHRRMVVAGRSARLQQEHSPAKTLRLLKPHGSITWHLTETGPVEILDAAIEGPKAIVVPGPSKYEDALVTPLFDAMRTAMNEALNRAQALICVGFGFNDPHLQGVIEQRLGDGMPTLILTKGLTDNIKAALARHPGLIAFSEAEDGSLISFGSREFVVAEPIWQLDSFLRVFIE